MANTVHFDVCYYALGEVIQELHDLLQSPDDLEVKVSIKMYGPGGGNPAVTVTNLSNDTLVKVEAWFIANHMTWVDDSGTIHDHA